MIITLSLLLSTLGPPAERAMSAFCESARCTCIDAPAPAVALSSANAVFLGTVSSLRETTQLLDGEDSEIPAREVTFRVHASWKGVDVADRRIVVSTGHGGGDCGYNFEVGVTYLVYAHGGEGGLTTSICSRTAPAKTARADFDALGHPPLVRHQ